MGRRWDPDGESETQRSLYGLTNPYCKDMWLIHEPKNKGGYWFRNKRSDTQRIGMHWYLKGVIMCNMGGRQNLGDLNHESNSKAMAVNHLVIAWHDFSPPQETRWPQPCAHLIFFGDQYRASSTVGQSIDENLVGEDLVLSQVSSRDMGAYNMTHPTKVVVVMKQSIMVAPCKHGMLI